MVATLTTAAKNWLAINAGSGAPNYCFSPSGVSYVVWNKNTSSFDTHIGSTGDVLNAYYASHLVGRNNDLIIAGMDYIGLKALNGGVDIGTDDVNFVYTNDGSPPTELTYCPPPAHIISVGLTTSMSICAEPCTIDTTVTWINDGGIPGTFSPGITVDGILTEMPPELLAAGTSISHTFTVSGLLIAGSPHNICASPGTHCKLVYTVVTVDICNWIISRGGWANLAIFDIMQMISAYLGQINLGFTVTISYIMGAVSYYLGRLASGNTQTGCTFQ